MSNAPENTAWIGLGANLGDPVAQLRLAINTLDKHPAIEMNRVSSLYRSDPVGYADQPEFYNAVCAVQTTLPPQQLLRSMLLAESAIGRVRRGPHFGPRTVDLDLLLYADVICDTPVLTLPHPRLHQRRFVLEPLAELAPGLIIPGIGAVSVALELCREQGVDRMATALPESTHRRDENPATDAIIWPGPGAFTGTSARD